MDILSLASTPIPAYFVLGPLVILLVILVTLVAKSGPKPASVVVVGTPLQTPPEPITTPSPEPVVAQVTTPVTFTTPVPQVAAVVPSISSWKPAEQVAMPIVEQSVPVTAAETIVAPAPEVPTAPVQAPVELAPAQPEVTPETKPTF